MRLACAWHACPRTVRGLTAGCADCPEMRCRVQCNPFSELLAYADPLLADSVEVLFTPGLWVPLVSSPCLLTLQQRLHCRESYCCASALGLHVAPCFHPILLPAWLLSTTPCCPPLPPAQVCIQGTYILPGIPRLFQQMVEAHADRFRGPAAYSSTLFTNLGEGEAPALLLAGCMVCVGAAQAITPACCPALLPTTPCVPANRPPLQATWQPSCLASRRCTLPFASARTPTLTWGLGSQ